MQFKRQESMLSKLLYVFNVYFSYLHSVQPWLWQPNLAALQSNHAVEGGLHGLTTEMQETFWKMMMILTASMWDTSVYPVVQLQVLLAKH